MLIRTLFLLFCVLSHLGNLTKAPHVKWRNRRRHGGVTRSIPLPPECPMQKCQLEVENLYDVREQFRDLLDRRENKLLHFTIKFVDTNQSILDTSEYMGESFQPFEWVWAQGKVGRNLLGLPLDADVLSLYMLSATYHTTLNLHMRSEPPRCVIMLSPKCRLQAVRRALIHNVTHLSQHKHQRDYICHHVLIKQARGSVHMQHQCCDSYDYINGEEECHIYTWKLNQLYAISVFIYVISTIITLFSPVMVMKIKLHLIYNSATKFFRASLKHGITGQRNYVIRISSRQLINLHDPKPFSMPRFVFRLLCHCYGEGRCCIHCWGDWAAQPSSCKKQSWCLKSYFTFCRFLGVAVLYPVVFYAAVVLYLPKLKLFSSVLQHADSYFEGSHSMSFDVNIVALVLMPFRNPKFAIWVLFSFVAFVYTILLLSWPGNPLERCFMNYEGKRPFEQPQVLYNKVTQAYKDILQKLAYGEFSTKRHYFRIKKSPWAVRRTFLLLGRLLIQIPIFNVAYNLLIFDSRLYRLRHKNSREVDEAEDSYEFDGLSCKHCCQWTVSVMIWLAFLLLLSGYATSVFLMVQFTLHIFFYTCLGMVLHPSVVLPWLSLLLIMGFYMNDILATINMEHKDILNLIDENSPRISAVDDAENLFQEETIQILKTHNLGAVKFIDGDNTEYVSKELYYNVCTDLKCGWTRSIRRIAKRMSLLSIYVGFIFLVCYTFAAFVNSVIITITAAILLSLIPKFIQIYISLKYTKPSKKEMWAKIIPDILDRHIRVDRTKCLDDLEVDLSTYDVRPVGHLEMDVPKMVHYGNLKMWKFPWVVSADQQTQSTENFIVALGNKLAAAAFLSKIVTRSYSPDLSEEPILRQWSLLVENCILEGSSTASGINGIPIESIRLFPREVQSLVSPFRTGNTVDHVVDNINRELYGPYTKGVLVTIGNTPFAIGKLNSTIFAFNAGCHGEQVTDLFGAVVITTDFNTQNLQTAIKFIMDPYSPDHVPVYSPVPTEGFIFRSPEILEIESPSSLESHV